MRPKTCNVAPGPVLVVDKDPDAAESMGVLLKLRGHDTRTAVDIQQAIEIARRDRPSCMLVHIRTLGPDGYQFTSQVRRELAGPVLLIAVVDWGREEAAGEALAAGFDHHFIEPIGPEGLEALLAAVDGGMRSPEPPIGPEPRPPGTVRRHVQVADPLGLHLRPASLFVAVARRFAADVRVQRDGRWVNGKSILDLATLAAGCGDRLDLEASGSDAAEALEALAGLFSGGDGRLA